MDPWQKCPSICVACPPRCLLQSFLFATLIRSFSGPAACWESHCISVCWKWLVWCQELRSLGTPGLGREKIPAMYKKTSSGRKGPCQTRQPLVTSPKKGVAGQSSLHRLPCQPPLPLGAPSSASSSWERRWKGLDWSRLSMRQKKMRRRPYRPTHPVVVLNFQA